MKSIGSGLGESLDLELLGRVGMVQALLLAMAGDDAGVLKGLGSSDESAAVIGVSDRLKAAWTPRPKTAP